MYFRLFIMIVFTIMSRNVSAQNNINPEWIFVGSGKESAYYLKTDYAIKTTTGIKVWAKIYKTSWEIKGVVHKNVQVRNLLIVDCQGRQTKTLKYIVYNKSNKIIDSFTFSDDNEWEDVIPGSLGESMLEKACELFNN